MPPRSPYIEDDSLHDLQHKLRDISAIGYKSTVQSPPNTASLPPLPPRSAYVEDDSLRDLQEKLVCLANPSSPSQDLLYPPFPTPRPPDTGRKINI